MPVEDGRYKVVKTEDDFVSSLRPVLMPTHTAARIYFSAACTSEDGDVPFPVLSLDTRVGAKLSVVDRVRQMLRPNNDLSVSEGDHVVRIRIGNPPSDLLRVRIPRLTLTPDERYNGGDAMIAIENAPEVRTLVSRDSMTSPVVVVVALVNGPDKRLPHLPATLLGMTADQALDLTAKTFAMAISYGQCAQWRRYLMWDFYMSDPNGSSYFPWGDPPGTNRPLPSWLTKAIADRRANGSRDVILEGRYGGKRVFEVVVGGYQGGIDEEHVLLTADGAEICKFGGASNHVSSGSCDIRKIAFVRALLDPGN